MYQINDIVMYAAQGVCRITDIQSNDFNGTAARYYVLQPVSSENALLYVPADNPMMTEKMRRLLSKDEIYDMIRSLADAEPLWIENEHARKERYKELLSQGDRKALIQMVKTVYLHRERLAERGRKMHLTDERFFKEAEKLLYDEFALVLNINKEDVVPFIVRQLDQAAKDRKDECENGLSPFL